MATVDGKKTGGRKKGTPNKDTEMLFACMERLGVDFFEIICLFAMGDFESLDLPEYEDRPCGDGGTYQVRTITPDLMLKAAIKGAEFVLPKRKSIEITSGDKNKTFKLAYGPSDVAEVKSKRKGGSNG